jgi:hypothetical protein
VLPAPRKAFYRKFRATLPPVPTRTARGHRVLAPAETWRGVSNPDEFPVMYSVFPFGVYGLERPDLGLARDTWWHGYDNRREKRDFCWYQSLIFTARLGLTAEAEALAVGKFLNTMGSDPQMPSRARYPAFWDNPSFCEVPDMDHGGSAMVV